MTDDSVDEAERDGVDTRNKVILNVGGIRHETYVGTLRNIPDTRLHSLTNNSNPTQLAEFDPNSGEFFFDRHPIVFAQILNYYRTGKLHCPSDVCGPLFEEELAFWGLEDAGIETCCWMNYKKHGEAQANLNSFDKIVEEALSEPDYSFHDDVDEGQQTRKYRQVMRKYQSRIWVTLEDPSSSVTAKIIAMTSMLLIIASVIVSCLETVDYFSQRGSPQRQAIVIIEIACVVWFTVEFLVRITVCPSKRDFLKQIMNWLDLAAIAPFYLQLFLTNADMNSIVTLRIVRLIRVFRVLKLSRHSYSLQILGHTLRSSLSELFLLGFFLSIGVVIFSTLMYYAESESRSTKFTSIPAGFWWAVVTMTTLGYGDIVPNSLPGKLVGTCCAICGVLTIALPIPVIVSNFSLYYSHAKARQKSMKKKRPLVIGAANALKVIEPLVGSTGTGLRHSVFSTNSANLTPRVKPRPWPAATMEMTGSSFESSEPSPSLPRRGLPPMLDKMRKWPYNEEQAYGNKCVAGNEEREYSGGHDNEGIEGPEEIGGMKGVNYGDGFVLPTIEIQRNSSGSQLSSSNHDDVDDTGSNSDENDDKTARQWFPKERKKKTKISPTAKKKSSHRLIVETARPPSKTLPGRMGRRDSVFVVGFIGKKWQTRAAKRKNSRMSSHQKIVSPENELSPNLLHVSPTTSSRRSSRHDAVSVTTNTTDLSTPALSASPCSSPPFHFHPLSRDQSVDLSYYRRSSCPSLQTSTCPASPDSANINEAVKGWKSEDGNILNARQLMGNKATVDVTDTVTVTSPTQEERTLGEKNSTEASAQRFDLGGEFDEGGFPKRERPFSRAHSDSSLRGIDRTRASSRCSSPLVRQKALLSFHADNSDSEADESDGDHETQTLSPVLENEQGQDLNLNRKQNDARKHMNNFLENMRGGDSVVNINNVSPKYECIPTLAERRQRPYLTLHFPVNNVADGNCNHEGTVEDNRKYSSSPKPTETAPTTYKVQEDSSDSFQRSDHVESHSPLQQNETMLASYDDRNKANQGSEGTSYRTEYGTPEQNNDLTRCTSGPNPQQYSAQNYVDQGSKNMSYSTENNLLTRRNGFVVSEPGQTAVPAKTLTETNKLPEVSCRQSGRYRIPNQYQAEVDDNDSNEEGVFDDQNDALTRGFDKSRPFHVNSQASSVNGGFISNSVNTYHRKLSARKANGDLPRWQSNRVPLWQAGKRVYEPSKGTPLRNMVANNDSGIASVESRPSLESVSSFSEKNEPRGTLKTINEVEKLNYPATEGMPLFPFHRNIPCDNSRNFVVDIRDETVV